MGSRDQLKYLEAGKAGGGKGLKQAFRKRETMQDTEPIKALSTELNRLSEIGKRFKGYSWIYDARL